MHAYPLVESWFWFLSFVIVGADIIIAFVLLFGVNRALLGLGRTKAAPNVLIGSFPLVMIPIFAVPLSIVLHLASLSKIRAAHRSVMKQAVSA